ncbi:hypothetical protein LTR78_000703 [Recurvomyces mirabilis]|uniref:C2H2-type domain-containing protein n=1 Tax=Recurvomyces mirabilis TaxID=574656 RepID=A0AAE0WVR1_9PEZI|nr:hypothetical protein LTR78_000703 [Recurvomyces mirabilis]KAK5158673.1 hypothetical protein LTS14_002781 [Recurvomyces mirabilis]
MDCRDASHDEPLLSAVKASSESHFMVAGTDDFSEMASPLTTAGWSSWGSAGPAGPAGTLSNKCGSAEASGIPISRVAHTARDPAIEHADRWDDILSWPPTYDPDWITTGSTPGQAIHGPSSPWSEDMCHNLVDNLGSTELSFSNGWTYHTPADALGEMQSAVLASEAEATVHWPVQKTHPHIVADQGQPNLHSDFVVNEQLATLNPAILMRPYPAIDRAAHVIPPVSPNFLKPTMDTQVPAISCPDKESIPSGQQPGRVLKCAWPGSSCTYISGRGRPYEMKRHMDTVHLKIRSICRRCGRSFCREEKMLSHLRNAHAGIPTRQLAGGIGH